MSLVPKDLTPVYKQTNRGHRVVRHRAVEAVICGSSLTICFLLSSLTALAHEKWFHKGPWEPANWRNVAQFPAVALIAGVAVITILAALVRRRLARPNVFPGPVALGADPDGVTRFYGWVPVILAIHVAIPLLVYGIQGHLFAPYLNLGGVWQYWLGLIQVGAAIALFYGGLREIARAERERLREERKVEQELAAARERLEKERAHLVTVIEKLEASGLSDPDLQAKLSSVDNTIAQTTTGPRTFAPDMCT